MTLSMTRAIERSSGHLYTYREGTEVFGPYPGATAICKLQDSLGGTDGLLAWAVNLALDEVERRFPPQAAEWAAIRSLALQARNGPADLGTAVHAAVDQVNRGLTPTLGADTAPYVAQYGAALYQRGIRVLGSEKYVVNKTIGFGGTYDAIVEIDEERGPLDVKSGKAKPSHLLQLTGLSMGEWHGEAGLEPEPMPKLDSVGWILLLRPDSYELVRHDITDEDRQHFIYLVQTYHRIREWASSYNTMLKEAA